MAEPRAVAPRAYIWPVSGLRIGLDHLSLSSARVLVGVASRFARIASLCGRAWAGMRGLARPPLRGPPRRGVSFLAHGAGRLLDAVFGHALVQDFQAPLVGPGDVVGDLVGQPASGVA